MVYEIDLEMAPLKIQVEVVLKALSDFSDLELASSRKNIFLIKGAAPNFPFTDIFEVKDFKDLGKKFTLLSQAK